MLTGKIHICLVSRQPVPNLTPLIDPQFKPRKVIMLVSSDMQQQADWLQDTLRTWPDIRFERIKIENPWDIKQVQDIMWSLLDNLTDEIDKGQVLLNATGGTKLMSIAAYDVCRDFKVPVFYVHPEKDRVIWLPPTEKTAHNLADRIKLEAFFLAHGAKVSGKSRRNIPDPALLQTGEDMIENLDHYSKALGRLNFLAASAEKNLLSESIRKEDKILKAVINLFEEKGFLNRQGNKLKFNNEASRFFVNGGWLEYLVFDSVRRIRQTNEHIHDIAFSINIIRHAQGKDIPNELDVVFLHNNRLHIIECKTRHFRSEDQNMPGTQALYKLDSLCDLMGGLQARAMLVSYREIQEYDKKRAKDLNIYICDGTKLKNLQQHLTDFIH